MNRPKISVIIPVYNTQNYVKEAVESITKQSLFDIEIILINDGSTDNSLEILKTLAAGDNRITLINQEKKGVSIARNTGLNHAKGEFVYFMDSDDLLDSNALELCYNKCIKDELDFVLFDAESFHDLNKEINWFSYKRTNHLTLQIYSGLEAFNIQIRKYVFSPSVCLNVIRRSFLKENDIKFHPNILHEDQLFSVYTYLTAKRVGFIQESFFKRRIRENSIMTTKYTWKNIEGYFTVAGKLLDFSKKRNKEEQATIDIFLTQMLNAAIWQGHVLPLKQRIKVAYLSQKLFKRFICTKTILALLFKSLIK